MFSNIDLLLINNHKLERLKTQTLERKSYIFNIKSVFSHMDTFDKAGNLQTALYQPKGMCNKMSLFCPWPSGTEMYTPVIFVYFI